MRKFIAALSSSALLLSGCSVAEPGSRPQAEPITTETSAEVRVEQSAAVDSCAPELSSVSDPDFLQCVEDSVFASTEGELSSDDYVVESVVAKHVSKEYLEELDYNSRENIYFGYTLSEIEAQFEGVKYTFALGDNGETEVQSLESYDDTFDRVLKNVAIGSGVVLIAVTISLVAAPAGATAVSVVFAGSAKAGALSAISGAGLGGLVGGAVKAYETGDAEAAWKSAALGASEGFKWGAITGAVAGGVSKMVQVQKANPKIPTPRQSEQHALKKYRGVEQKSYLGGKEVPYATPGSTRPDIVRPVNGRLEAIEVKNYDLENGFSSLRSNLARQIADRKKNLPQGSVQRISLDVRGKNYSTKFVKESVESLKVSLSEIEPNIIIDVMRR